MQYKYQKKVVLRIKNKNLKLCIGNRVKSHRVKIPKPLNNHAKSGFQKY